MNSIELTKEHKAKLLEMCNKLFSEEGKWFAILDGKMYYSKKGTFPGFSIHWFEFCYTILVETLSNKLNNWEDIPKHVSNIFPNTIGKWNLYTKFHFYYPKASLGGTELPINPIDYLYEEFKKLK